MININSSGINRGDESSISKPSDRTIEMIDFAKRK